MKKAIDWLFPRKPIGDGKGNVFFWRRQIINNRLFGIFVHSFERGDNDRCLHDHPWSFVAVILRGGYYEEMFVYPDSDQCEPSGKRPTKFHWRSPGTVLYRPAKTAHRITLLALGPKVVSLVFVGTTVRPWGFWTLSGWRQWIKGQPNPICETNP